MRRNAVAGADLNGIAAGAAALVLVMAGLLAPQVARAAPDLWGVDEDDGQLFRITDYDGVAGPTTFTSFGDLMIDEGAGPVAIGPDIEAVTLAPDGTLFMAVDRGLGGFSNPTLVTFDIDGAVETGPNVVDVIGTLGIPFDDPEDNVSGLSIDPLTGELYALLKNASPLSGFNAVDELWVIPDPANDPLSASFVGALAGAGGNVLQGEDLEFDAAGVLYVADDRSTSNLFPAPALDEGALWEIQLERAAGGSGSVTSVTDVVLVELLTGLFGAGNGNKIEALGWDFENDRLIGSDDDNDVFAILVGPGSVAPIGPLGGTGQLTDVEGIDFQPEGLGPPAVPEPAALLLLAIPVLLIAARRHG